MSCRRLHMFKFPLQGLSALIRIGANDRTVHPFFARRMYRLLTEERINVTYNELAGKEHWWWDTRCVSVIGDVLLRPYELQTWQKYHVWST